MSEAKLDPLTVAELDELERLEREASPGEWESQCHEGCCYYKGVSRDGWILSGAGEDSLYVPAYESMYLNGPDARLIAAARNALPRLIAMAREVVRLENELKTEKLVNDVLVAVEKEKVEA